MMLMHPATSSAWLTGLVHRFSPIFGTHPDPSGGVRVCDSQRRFAEQGGKQDFASLMKQVLPPETGFRGVANAAESPAVHEILAATVTSSRSPLSTHAVLDWQVSAL